MRKAWPILLLVGWGLAVGGTRVARAQQAETKKEQKAEEKKTKKKREPPPGSGETGDVAVQERRAIKRVLQAFADGFEGNSPRRITENLDERFYDFPRFEDQVTEFLKRNAEIRLYLRESSSEVKGDKATLIVDAEMILADKADPARTQKRRERIQFDFVRTDKGWKIYEINPRRFFTP